MADSKFTVNTNATTFYNNNGLNNTNLIIIKNNNYSLLNNNLLLQGKLLNILLNQKYNQHNYKHL